MHQRGSTGVWQRHVDGLGHGFKYKFAVDGPSGSQLRTDPFARMLGNEVNRTPHFVETTSSVTRASAWRTKFVGPLNVYEVHPLSWRWRDGRPMTYLELIDELVPYVRHMEYTHVELMGIQEHPSCRREQEELVKRLIESQGTQVLEITDRLAEVRRKLYSQSRE